MVLSKKQIFLIIIVSKLLATAFSLFVFNQFTPLVDAKLYQNEFVRWFKLTSEILPLLKIFRQESIHIPTLYIMGDQDYMFLPSVEKVSKLHPLSELLVLEKCGTTTTLRITEVIGPISRDSALLWPRLAFAGVGPSPAGLNSGTHFSLLRQLTAVTSVYFG